MLLRRNFGLKWLINDTLLNYFIIENNDKKKIFTTFEILHIEYAIIKEIIKENEMKDELF